MFNYTNAVGNNDGIKVEINYSNRCHVLPVIDVNVAIPYLDDVVVRTLSPIELFATKINALIGRGAARDIYDVYNMVRHNMFPKAEEKDLLRKTILFYLTVGSSRKDKVTPIEYISFPQIDKVRFPQIRSQLLPVLKRSENLDFEAAKSEAKTYLTKLLTLTDEEKQYVENFNQRKYSPELLFPNAEIIERIKSHPMALWKTGIK